MTNFHILQAYNKIGLQKNLSFWTSIIESSQKVIDPKSKKNVLDFGCGNGKFLQLFDLMDSLEYGLGLELNEALIESANNTNTKKNIQYKISTNEVLNKFNGYFDVAFSQEVLCTIEKLENHAKNIFTCLKENSFYFATMGCHIDNPLWSKRRDIIV